MRTSFKSPLAPLARIVSASLLMFATTVASAEEAAGGPTLPAVVGSDEILNMAGSLMLIIGAIVVVGWLYLRVKGTHGHNAGFIKILAAQPLGSKERILLVEVANQQLVLGVTSTQIQTLYVLEQSIDSTASVHTTSRFAERLRTAIGGARK